jgi:TP901 family phage tail tape measure protein
MSDKEVRVKITGDISDLLKKLEKVKDAFDDLGDGKGSDKFLNNIVDELQKVQKETDATETKMEDLVSSTKKLDDKAFNNMADGIGKTNKQVNEFTVGITKANEQMQTLAETGEQVQNILKKTSKSFDINTLFDKGSDKGSNSFFSNIIDGFISGTVAGERMSHTFEGIKDSIGTMTNSLKDITDNLDLEKVVKAFDKLPENIDTAKKSLDALYEERKKLQVLANEVEDVFEEDSYTESAKRAQQSLKVIEELIAKEEALLKAQKSTERESLNKLKNYSKYYEDLSAKVNDFINDETQGILVREKVAKSFKEVTEAMENMYRVQKEGSPDKSQKAMMEEYDALIEKVRNLKKELTELKEKDKVMSDLFESFTYEDLNSLERLRESLKDLINTRRDYVKSLDDTKNAERDAIKAIWDLGDARAELEKRKNEIGFDEWQFEELSRQIREAKKEVKDFKKAFGESFENLSDDFMLDYIKSVQKFLDEFEGVYQEFKDAGIGIEDFTKQIWDGINGLSNYSDATKNTKDRIAEIENEIKDYVAQIKELEQAQKDAAKAEEYMFSDEPAKIQDTEIAIERATEAYKKLGKEIVELRDKTKLVTEGFERVSNSNLDNRINDLTNEARDFSRTLSLIDFDTLKNGLDKLGTSIEDKRDKLVRFNEINKELDESSRKAMYSFEKQGESIRDFANKAGFAVEVFEELIDNARKIGSDGFNIVGNEENLRRLERQRQLLDENSEELKEYLRILKESGKEVPKRLMDAFNNFDMSKFVHELETFGKPMNQLTAQMQTYKQQILENMKYEKENIELMRETAKANLEKAKATKDVIQAEADMSKKMVQTAKSQKDADIAAKQHKQDLEYLAEAIKEVAKAEQEFAETNEKADRADEDRIAHAKELIETYNRLAKELRRLGVEIKDISKIDIGDRSLASMLNDVFPDENVPKKFKDYVEDIKAIFSELNDFELGNAGNILKDIGKGLVDMIPAEIKTAAGVIGGISTALYKLYDAGKQQFFQGLSGAGDKLKSVMSALRNFGQEARDAFENITDTQLDLSSLMELGPNFEYDMAKVGAIAGSNKKQLEELTRTAEHLGGVTQYTASDVAEAFQYMAMAGYDTEEMLSSINGTLSLSIASGTGLAETTDIVTDYMTALGLEANSTSDFVDKLAATVTSSNTNVKQYGMSMKQVASQAGALGITMTDLSTAIGLQANAGVKGAKAGTALKNVLANMAAPTEKQAAALEKLGFAANETGSYFKLTEDGAVDLEATIKQLMTATDNMTKSQKAAVLAQFAGREALPGLMALLSQGAEGWNELSATIENSTGKVQYWNECMSLVGKSGKEATAAIENMKEVFAEVEAEALEAGLSSQELSHAIAVLGDDGKVSSDNIRDLISVIDSMNTATGEAEEKWRALDKAGDDFVNTGYDYDATIAKITADTTGLSQKTKDLIKDKLDESMTLEEANAVLKEYGLTAERVSFSTLEYAEKLQYLRDNLKGCTDEEIKTQLANLGLAESFDEVSEVVKMSDKEFAAYKQNLETVKGMAEQLAEAMDETTKASLLNLASAIENVCIAAFNKIKPALKGAVDAVNEFFDTWHNGQENKFTFDGLERGLEELSNKISNHKGNIEKAVSNLFDGLDKFINGELKTQFSKINVKDVIDSQSSAFDSLLKMGTDMVQSICKGIEQAKNSGSLDRAIDGAIKKICNWITTNGPTIEEAGKTIIDAVADGISNNESAIRDALESIVDIMSSWASSSSSLKTAASNFSSTFVDYAVDSIGRSIKEKGTEIWNSLFGLGDFKDPESGGLFLTKNPLELIPGVDNLLDGMFDGIEKGLKWAWDGICGWFTGEAHAAEIGGEVGTQFSDGYNDSLNNGKEKTVNTANEIGTGISEGITSRLESMDASQLQLLQTELTNLQTTTQTVATGMGTSFTAIQNSARTSFTGLTNIIRNQMLNVSNIMRNQLLNCTNIVRNQALNMSNIFRNQFVNMANIVRNQAVNMANIMRNQMVNMSNIVRNQAVNMSNIFRNQFVNMANIVRNQMTNCTNIVRNQAVNMSNIFRNQFVNMANIVRNQMTNCTNIIRNQCVNMANIFRNQFVNMANVARNQFVNVANIVRNQMTSCANIVRNQCVNMANIFRNQFVSMANVARNQMVNVSNIIRNQAVSWSNVIRNQVTNARNALTQQMISMASVTRTQMVNITNIIRNQSTQWASLVQSGASRAKSSFNSSFSGLASVARSQMANCLSIVRSYMNQIAAATSRTMTMNFKVNKSVTTTNITKNVTQGARATMGNTLTNMRGISQPNTMSTSMSNGSINLAPANNGISGSLALEVPLFLDGREIARASASYSQAELAKLEKRSKRKRGE